jgi:hypothetical protein
MFVAIVCFTVLNLLIYFWMSLIHRQINQGEIVIARGLGIKKIQPISSYRTTIEIFTILFFLAVALTGTGFLFRTVSFDSKVPFGLAINIAGYIALSLIPLPGGKKFPTYVRLRWLPGIITLAGVPITLYFIFLNW